MAALVVHCDLFPGWDASAGRTELGIRLHDCTAFTEFMLLWYALTVSDLCQVFIIP